MATSSTLVEQLQELQKELLHTVDEDSRQTTIKKMGEITRQQLGQGDIATINRTLNGQATVCVDKTGLGTPNFSGAQTFSLTLTIIQPLGITLPTLHPLTIEAGNVTVTITQEGGGSGHYDFDTGNLDVTFPNLHIVGTNVPIIGHVNTRASLTVSTRTSVSTQKYCDIGDFQGSPAQDAQNATGPITLVGATTFQVFWPQNVTIEIQMAGTLIVI